MKVRKLALTGAIVSVVGVALAFQNCSQDLPDAASNYSSGTPTPPAIDNTKYKKDENFNYAYVAKKSQMVETMLTARGYAGATTPKAVAVNADGLGFVTVTPAGSTQDDASLSALEGCYALGGGKPCALLAVGDKFNLDKSALASSYSFTMTAPTTLTAASLPFATAAAKSAAYTAYASASQPKALVASADGVIVWVSHNNPEGIGSVAEATRMALERCEMMALITPCTSVAENNAITFTPNLINRSALIDFAKVNVSGWFPGHSNSHGNNQINGRLTPSLANGGGGAVYITADGRYGADYDYNQAAAVTNAMNQCKQNENPAYPCFRYSTNANVVMNSGDLTAVKASLDLHCKAVPRLNCTQHKAMGCPAGTYYTTFTGAITTENCL